MINQSDIDRIKAKLEAILNKTYTSGDFIEIKAIVIGAFHSFCCAKTLGYCDDIDKDIDDDNYLSNVLANSDGRSIDNKWEAGFFYNSSLYRISAAYHRIMKVYARKQATKKTFVNDLLRIAKRNYGFNHTTTNLEIVHKKVNGLKHEVLGLNATGRPTVEQVITSFNELIEIMDNMDNRQKIKKIQTGSAQKRKRRWR